MHQNSTARRIQLRKLRTRFMGVVVLVLLFAFIQPAQRGQAVTSHKVFLPLVMHQESAVRVKDCPAGDSEWLCMLNEYRRIAGLPAVSENPDFSSALGLHDNYLLLNADKIESGIISSLHDENPAYPGYTADGAEAGVQSNMVWNPGPGFTTRSAMETWMTFAGHRYGMLHPDIGKSGYDLSCDSQHCAAGLNILGDLPLSYQYTYKNIAYPVNGQADVPPGTEISWAFYRPWTDEKTDENELYLLSARFSDGGRSIPFTTREPDHSNNSDDYRQMIVLIPQETLQSGHTYTVYMKVRFQGVEYTKTWSFITR